MTAATAASPEADVGAGTEVETIKHEVASGGSDAKGGDEEVRVAPQARPDDDDDVLLRSNRRMVK